MRDYAEIKSTLANFLATYKKEAEDPNREALVPEDLKEGAPATTEAPKGDGKDQGAAGKETAKEIKNSLPPGTAAGEPPTLTDTTDNATAPEGIVNPATAKVSESPEDDMARLDNQDVALKKASAAQIKFEVGLMNMIDRWFDQAASKTAADEATKVAADEDAVAKGIIQAATAWKNHHINQVVQAFGCSPKIASDMLDQLAEEDPEAILPPEAISEEEADDVLAAAAEADAASAADTVDPEQAAELGDGLAAEGAPGAEGGEGSDEDMQAALEEAVVELRDQGLSPEEILSGVMEASGMAPEDMIDAVVTEMKGQGLSDEEIADLADQVDQLQAEGVTAADLMASMEQE